ncbi:MAG: hypothetical protein PVJ38_08945 [Candidatus Bathyarchaeota archaeon]
MGEEQPYHFVRFLWMATVDLEEMADQFEAYVEGWREPPETETGMHTHIYNLRELKLKADTLQVYLSLQRAVLFQRERKPFTQRDVELRKRVFEVYPRSRPTPFPWLELDEPDFEVEGEG